MYGEFINQHWHKDERQKETGQQGECNSELA